MKVSEISPIVELSGLKFGLPHFTIKLDQSGKEIAEDKLISLMEESDFYKIRLINIRCEDLSAYSDLGGFVKVLTKRGYEVSIDTVCSFWDEQTLQYADFLSILLKPDFDVTVFQKILRKVDFKTEFKINITNEDDLNFAQKMYDEFFRKQVHGAGTLPNNFLQLIMLPNKKGMIEKDFLNSTQKRVFTSMPDVRLMPVVSFKVDVLPPNK